MLHTIYKYQLQITDRQTITIPASALILSVQFQNGVLCLWALVNPIADQTTKNIAIIGTGNPIENLHPRNLYHLATAQDEDGFVWHVFEILNA